MFSKQKIIKTLPYPRLGFLARYVVTAFVNLIIIPRHHTKQVLERKQSHKKNIKAPEALANGKSLLHDKIIS